MILEEALANRFKFSPKTWTTLGVIFLLWPIYVAIVAMNRTFHPLSFLNIEIPTPYPALFFTERPELVWTIHIIGIPLILILSNLCFGAAKRAHLALSPDLASIIIERKGLGQKIILLVIIVFIAVIATIYYFVNGISNVSF